MTELRVYWGSPGTGKSKRAFEEASSVGPVYVLPAQSKGSFWADGYCGQPTVIWDDFDPALISRALFCRLIDRYACTVPVKGGFTNWSPRLVILTTNVCPSVWWPDESGVSESWLRRITTSVMFVAPSTGFSAGDGVHVGTPDA